MADESLSKEEMDLLLRVNATPGHYIASDEVSPEDEEVASELMKKYLLRLMPARGRWPERYVVTSGGSHAVGTFDGVKDLTLWKKNVRRRFAL